MKFTDLFTNKSIEMVCFVCTENANQTLAIFRDGEINSKIAVIIEKHLRLKPQLIEKQEEALEICNQCWEKLRDFNEFFEYVAKVHKEQTEYLPGQLENIHRPYPSAIVPPNILLDEIHILEPHIKTETLQENLDDNAELHFFETNGVSTENPLLEVTSEYDNDGMEEEFINIDTKNKNEKQKNTKPRRSKRLSKRSKTTEVNAVDEYNEQSLASLLDNIKPIVPTNISLDEKHILEPYVKTETLEETLDDNVELHFFEPDDVTTENPLLELTPEDNNSRMEEFINIGTINKNEKQENNKTSRSEDSFESYDANNELKEGPVKKKKTKRTSLSRTEAKRTIKADNKTNEPKHKKGHVLLEENYDFIKKHIKMFCQMCFYIGEDYTNLTKHYKEKHADVKPFIRCCERKLDCPSDILQHAYFHEDPEHFKCQICGKTFINNCGLKDHIMNHHEPEENLPFGCDECPRRFSRRKVLERHKAKHIPKAERSHFCEICQPPKAFASDYILQIHIKSRHTNASNICHVCAKKILDKKTFEKHVRSHFVTSGSRIKCPRKGCGSWLKDKHNLQLHLRSLHKPAKFECPECGRICKNKHSLTCHLRNTHSNQIFTCDECQKNFKSAMSLKEHMASHTGVPLYSCPFCTKTFNFRANMYTHRKKVHPLEYHLVHKSKIDFMSNFSI
ncbi:transcription factor grauzone-like isoform X2 [Lucilia sericata]|uniref:transcription factor grauzone-like isoform X2 n=1 Tax=Lucilia sericata TaxID=13632 RepID=UPI0018A87C0F|nr:transcription factor grauzone-like isoform X2 [Lucilia sericata]